MLSYFSTVSSLTTLQMNCLGTPQHRKLSHDFKEHQCNCGTPDKATYSSTTTIILPFVDNFTASSTELCDSSPSPSQYSLRAAPDRAQVPLLLYRLQLGLSLCWRFPRRVPQRTASLLVTLFVFHRVALLLELRFHTQFILAYILSPK